MWQILSSWHSDDINNNNNVNPLNKIFILIRVRFFFISFSRALCLSYFLGTIVAVVVVFVLFAHFFPFEFLLEIMETHCF